MGFFDGPDSPNAPDPKSIIKKQTKANIAGAVAQQNINNYGQTGPAGETLRYKVVGHNRDGTPRYQAIQTLGAGQQGLLNTDEQYGALSGKTGLAQLGNAQEMYSHPIDLSNPSIGNDISNKLAPQFQAERERQRLALDSTLGAKGIRQGDPAYTTAMKDFDANQNDAWDRQTVSARAQMVDEMMKQRALPLDEIEQLTGQARGSMKAPAWINTPQATVQPTDVAGITQNSYEDQLAAAQLEQSYKNALIGGFAGMGSAAITGGMTPVAAGAGPSMFSRFATKYIGI